MINTVLFDMHGVILKDPHGNLEPFIRQTFPEMPREEIYKWWLKATVGELSSHDFFHNLGYVNPAEAERVCLDTIEIDETFYEVAKQLRKCCKLALVTNEIFEWADYICTKFDLRRYFDLVVISGEVGVKKPDPRIFELVLDRLEAKPEECVFIDDMTRQLAGAVEVGIHTIHYKGAPGEHLTAGSLAELPELIRRIGQAGAKGLPTP